MDPNKQASTRLNRLLITVCVASSILLSISLLAKNFGDYIRADTDAVNFNGYYFSDDNTTSVEDVIKLIQTKDENLKFNGELESKNYGSHWLWVNADAVNSRMKIFLVELAWLDRIQFYTVTDSGGVYQSAAGDDLPFYKRVIPFRKPSFPIAIEVDKKKTGFYIFEIGAQGRLSFPVLAADQKTFDAQRDLDHFFYGGIVAILLALGAYNATIFFSLRENVHFYYMFYIFAFGFLQIIASGMAQQYLWPNAKDLSSLYAHIFLALTNFSITYFVIHFISLKTYSNLLFHLLRALAWTSLSCIPFLFFFDYFPFKTVLHSCSFVIMALIFPAAIYTLLRGNEVAHYLLASNIVLFPSVAIGLLRFLGMFEHAYWAEHLSELGIAAEALILSVGLAYRVNLLRQEKDNIALAREIEKSSFAQKVIQSKEDERKTIGRALHDSLGHKILTIKNSIQSAMLSESVNHENLFDLVDQAIEEVRDLSHLLHPAILDHLGLEKSVASILRSSVGPTKVNYELEFALETEAITYESQLLLYRATQESVNNLIKHSDASQFKIKIESRMNSEVVFSAEDNGSTGFLEQDFGYGLTMLKQQAVLLGGDASTCKNNGTNQLIVKFFDRPEVDR